MATKAKAQKRFERILFPTDFSGSSEDAACYALMLARQHGSELFALHVVETPIETAGIHVPHPSYEQQGEESLQAALDMLERSSGLLFKGFDEVSSHAVSGEPYKEIIRFAKKTKIDLIVMGASGKGGIDRFLFGSTTERVLRKTHCPVLVIPPQR